MSDLSPGTQTIADLWWREEQPTQLLVKGCFAAIKISGATISTFPATTTPVAGGLSAAWVLDEGAVVLHQQSTQRFATVNCITWGDLPQGTVPSLAKRIAEEFIDQVKPDGVRILNGVGAA